MPLGPDVWGPHGWKFLHFVAIGYPKNPTDEDKLNYKNFFTMIPNILPCSICSDHYSKNLIKYPLTNEILTDRIKLFNWTVDMHNEVNITNNKNKINYDLAFKLLLTNFTNDIKDEHQITHNAKKKNTNNVINTIKLSKKSNYWYYLILLVGLIILILYIYYIKKNHLTPNLTPILT